LSHAPSRDGRYKPTEERARTRSAPFLHPPSASEQLIIPASMYRGVAPKAPPSPPLTEPIIVVLWGWSVTTLGHPAHSPSFPLDPSSCLEVLDQPRRPELSGVCLSGRAAPLREGERGKRANLPAPHDKTPTASCRFTRRTPPQGEGPRGTKVPSAPYSARSRLGKGIHMLELIAAYVCSQAYYRTDGG
jgi:hypothetical protein